MAAPFTWRDFQIWFAGFSENIDDAPTDKQWARVKARIAEVDDATPRPPPLAAEPAASSVTPSAMTKVKWCEVFNEALLDQGLDPESINDMTGGNIAALYDPKVEPKAAANQLMIAQGMPVGPA